MTVGSLVAATRVRVIAGEAGVGLCGCGASESRGAEEHDSNSPEIHHHLLEQTGQTTSMRERSRPRNLSRLRPSMIDPDKERGKD
jgi:hypothetical protein